MAGLRNVSGAPARPVPSQGAGKDSKAAAKDSIFFKTVMCRFYKAGKCTRGRHCSFAHSKVEKTARPDLTKTKMCPMLSSCKDPRCTYAHSRAEILKLDAESFKPLKSEPIQKSTTKQAAFDFDSLTTKAMAMADAAMSTGLVQDMVLSTLDWKGTLASALPEKILTQSSLATTSAASSFEADDSDSAGNLSEDDTTPRLLEEAQLLYLAFDSSGSLLVTCKRPSSLAATMGVEMYL